MPPQAFVWCLLGKRNVQRLRTKERLTIIADEVEGS